jgi:Helix-turn-helix domain
MPDDPQLAFPWSADEDQNSVPPGPWRTRYVYRPTGAPRTGREPDMAYTLTQASRACGKSKATLLRAIRSGRLSAVRDDVAGSWLIEESELHRVFPPGTAVPGTNASNDAPRTPARTDRTAELEARITEMQEAARLRDDTIADLRRRLDTATGQLGEALQQMRLLTDQRAATPAPARRWLPWGRR